MTMYHESDARRNVREIEEEQAREGVLRELFGEFDEGSIAPVGTGDDEITLTRLDELMNSVSVLDVTTFEDTVRGVLEEAADLIIERQRTYGPSNIEEQGVMGIVNRITMDKAARIRKRLNGRIENGEVVLDPIELGSVDEPGIINDAFDFIGYGVCLILLLRGEWGKPLAGEGA